MVDDNSEREQDPWGEGGKDDRYILVVGFTKEASYQFLRIRQNKEGSIYLGFAYRDYSPHLSYHASGEVHQVGRSQDGKLLRTEKVQAMPVAQFRDSYSLGNYLVASSDFSFWKPLMPAKERRIQALFCFDMSYMSAPLGITFDLLEKERFDLLSKMITDIPSKLHPQILVVTATDPWIVIRAFPD